MTDDGFVQAVGNFGETWVHCAAEDRPGVQADCLFRVGFDEEERNPWDYEDYVSFGGHNYFRYTGRFSWYKAQELAERFGGYLAVITSEEENNAVAQISDRDLWIGASDDNCDGIWDWVTGEMTDINNEGEFHPFREGEPDYGEEENGSIQKFLHIDPGGAWDDVGAYNTDMQGFIVEVDLGWIDMPTDMTPLQSGEGHFQDLHGAAGELGLSPLYDYGVDIERSTRGHDGENSDQLTGFGYDDKYNTNSFPAIVNFSIPEPTVITGIVLTTGNDSGSMQGRNPSRWLIAATNTPDDLSSWDIIAYGDASFLENLDQTAYAAPISNSEAYQYFKFEAEGAEADEWMQLSSVTLCTGSDNIAEGSFTDENDNTMNWWIQADGSFILSGHGLMPDFSVDNRPPWYEYRNQIYNFSITEDSFIDRIGDYAFEGCSNLHLTEEAAVRIGSVGCYAFSGIRDGYANLENCGWIGDFAFAYSGIDHLSIPNVVYINQGAFLECHNLHGELVIPASCSEINARAFEEAFNGNSDENRLIIEEGNWDASLTGDNVWNFNYEETHTNPLWIQDTAFYACRFGGGLYLPDRVQEVGNGAFDEAICWGELRLSNSMTYIGEGTFSNNGFNGNVEIPESVTYIARYAFMSSSSDGALIINEGVTEIDEDAFREVHFNNDLSLPDSLQHVCPNAFRDADFEHHYLFLGEGLTEIDEFAFAGSNFGGDLEIPDSVVNIGQFAFNCGNFDGTLTIGSGLTTISYKAFSQNPFAGNLVIPENITAIDGAAFEASDFNGTLTLSPNLTYIEHCAFRDCGDFTGNIVIPDTVEWIGWEAFCRTGFNGTLILGTENSHLWQIQANAFRECGNLHGGIVIPDSVTEMEAEVFWGDGNFTGDLIIGNGLVNLPDGAFPADFTGNLVIGNSVEYIPQHYFEGFNFTGTLTIGDSVRNIDDWAFHRCQFTGHLTMGANVERIGKDAFSWSYGYTGLTLNEGLRIIEDAAFYNGDEGESGFRGNLVIPNSVEAINWAAFDKTGFDGNLTLGDNLGYIGSAAFNQVPFTGSLVIPNGCSEIRDDAFNYAGFNGNLTLGSNLQSIGNHAFDGVQFVGDLVIPDQVGFIGNSAFSWAKIDTVTFNGYVDTIDTEAFDCEENLITATFNGNAPANFGEGVFNNVNPDFAIYYDPSAEGWSTPEWNGYPCYPISARIVITQQPENKTVTVGDPVAFTVVAEGGEGTLTYLWQYSTDNRATEYRCPQSDVPVVTCGIEPKQQMAPVPDQG